MKTKQRVLLALLAAAVLLGAALWAVIRSNAKAEQAASAAPRAVSHFPALPPRIWSRSSIPITARPTPCNIPAAAGS